MNLLLCTGSRDASYIGATQYIFDRQFTNTFTKHETPTTFTELMMWCKSKNCQVIATTQKHVAEVFCGMKLDGSVDDNHGFYYERQGLRLIVIPALVWKFSVPEGEFLIKHYLHKLSAPQEFISKDAFSWQFLTPENFEFTFLRWHKRAKLIAVDIETHKEGLRITSVAYTALLDNLKTETYVIRFSADTIDWAVPLMRSMNGLEAPKIMQNGRYDTSYFIRFNAPLYNYLHDTYHLMHCFFSELPKTLAFISGFFILNYRYWKAEKHDNLYEYNAKDTHNTLWAYIAMAQQMRKPEFAYVLTNYLQEFPIVFPCIQCGQEGIATLEPERLRLRAIEVEKSNEALSRLRAFIGNQDFNPKSPKQSLQLLHALGFKKAEASDKKTMQEFSEAHPLNEFIASAIDRYRKAEKAISTYYDVSLLHGRMYYELDPAATETGRLGSKESNYWCGTQIQNMPPYAKSMYIPDPGYEFSEVDKSQAESRCTAYISEDTNLINTVENSPDFHCTNASLFFGIPFSTLFDIENSKVLRKDIRTVAKRVNHGANYNMGAFVLWQTMGTKAVLEAKRLLQLPANYSVLMVCEHLLACFRKAYPKIKGEWYGKVIKEVKETGHLVGPTGWTRRTFLKPWDKKPDLNACVAHPPQSLSVMLVNKAFMIVWRDLQHGEYKGLMRLKAQIHDSLFFQYKIGHGYIAEEIEKVMRVPITINGRVMVIPGDVKKGATSWGGLKD